jgi:hypothetical protein
MATWEVHMSDGRVSSPWVWDEEDERACDAAWAKARERIKANRTARAIREQARVALAAAKKAEKLRFLKMAEGGEHNMIREQCREDTNWILEQIENAEDPAALWAKIGGSQHEGELINQLLLLNKEFDCDGISAHIKMEPHAWGCRKQKYKTLIAHG